MGKKKRSVSSAEKQAPAALSQKEQHQERTEVVLNPDETQRSLWPEEFAPARSAAIMAAACIVLAIIVFGAAGAGGFTAVKVNIAERLGLGMPELVSAANYDIAMVIFGIGAVVLAGLVHPCLGITLLLLPRAWLDGYTFPADNTYFTWCIYALCAIWLLRVIRKRERIQHSMATLLFGGVLLVMLLTTRYSYQYYATYQLLWLWVGYGALFMLSHNTTHSRKTAGIVLAVFLFAMGVQALFSILHLKYLLPHMRTVMQNPAVLRHYFGIDSITPELARRVSVNRAFGTMLFPNALAAYLLLGIPFLFAMVVPYGRSLRAMLKRNKGATHTARFPAMGVSALCGMTAFAGVLFVTHFPIEYRDKAQPLPVYFEFGPLVVLAFLLACAVALFSFYLVMRYGLPDFWVLSRFAGTVLLAPLLFYALWLTYSRGALLSLALAGSWACLLLWLTPERLHWKRYRLGAAALLVLTLVLVGSVLSARLLEMPSAWAQDPPAQAAQTAPPVNPHTQVPEAGISLSMTELVDPASFRLRIGYWHVTLRMALDNLLTGVGLGNFDIAYPIYQYVGAGDVREAHNGFLQMFAETGVFGGILFAAFWVYIALWGAGRILLERNRDDKLFLLGLYTGIIAFSLHAFLDINFSHPSLMMFAMVCVGLFCAQAGPAPETVRKGRMLHLSHAAAAVLILAFLLAATGAGLRLFKQQLALNRLSFINVSSENERATELNRRMRVGQFFLVDLPQYAHQKNTQEDPPPPPRIQLSMARLLFEDIEKLKEGCVFYRRIPETPTRFRRLEPDEPITPDTLLVIHKPGLMHRYAAEAAERWIDELKFQDQRFPHSPTLAMHIARWYQFYVHHVHLPALIDQRPRWLEEYMRWAEILRQRNPYHADIRAFYGNALIWPLLHEDTLDTEQKAQIAAAALSEWERVVALSPISPSHRFGFAWALEVFRDHFKEVGDEERAAYFDEYARKARVETAELAAARRDARIYP